MSKREEKRCKLMFEKKKKNKAHMATKAHKLTLSFPTASHKITTQKSFNEIHVGALLWLWIAHPQHLPALHRTFGALSEFLLAVDCIACFLFLPHHTKLFFQ